MNDTQSQSTTIIGIASDTPDKFYYLANLSPGDHDPEAIWSVIVEVRDWANDDQDDSFEEETWLCAIDGDTRRGVYAVSVDGEILHLSKRKWISIDFPNDTALNTLHVADVNKVFLGGDNGLLGLLEHGKVKTFNTPQQESINAIHCASHTKRTLAVGNTGTAFEYIGPHWQDLLPPTNACLMSVCASPEGVFYIGAEKGLIFCVEDGKWREIDLNDDAIVYGLAYLDGVLYCALGEKGLISCTITPDDVHIKPIKDWAAYELSRQGNCIFGTGEDYLFRYSAGVWERWQIDL